MIEGHVHRMETLDDHGRPPVDHPVIYFTRLIIGRIARQDHFARQLLTQFHYRKKCGDHWEKTCSLKHPLVPLQVR